MPTLELITDKERRELVKEVEAWSEAVGMTPQVLCVMAGLSHSTWYNWHGGQAAPQVSNVALLRAEMERLGKMRGKR